MKGLGDEAFQSREYKKEERIKIRWQRKRTREKKKGSTD
jgi:hypothetical protein